MDLLSLLKHCNGLLGDLEALTSTARVRSMPPHLEVDPTSQCNLRCVMCHQSKTDMGRWRLEPSEIDALIDALPCVDTLMVAGLGEPLLSPNLGPLLRAARRYGCRTHVFTNGMLIDSRLDDLRHADRVSVSFDGATGETFESLRPGADFARIVDNIRLLRAAAPSMRLVTSTVVSRRNLPELADLAVLAHELGMDEVHFSPVDHTPAIALRPTDAAAYRAQIDAARARTAGTGLRIFDNITQGHFRDDRNAAVSEADATRSPPVAPRPRGPARWTPLAGTSAARPDARVPIHHRSPWMQRGVIAWRLLHQAFHVARLGLLVATRRRAAALPWCSAPWKYGFARSRGDARLCPYAEVGVGPIPAAFAGAYNTPLLEQVRRSMAHGQPLLDVCRRCSDDHRRFRAPELLARLARWRGR